MNQGAPPLMAESDETLVSRTVRLKDATAYAELVRRYEQKILLLQQRLTGERALAEDLSQETFLRAWQKLNTFNASGSFGGWLASVAYNVFRAHWRKHKRQSDQVALDDLELSAPATDETGSADLDRLLAMLPRQDQVILTLCYAYGLSNTEVGQVLDMPAGTVKARIHRAKAKIRTNIATPGGAAPAASNAPVDQTSSMTPTSSAHTPTSSADSPTSSAVSRLSWLRRQRPVDSLVGNSVSKDSLTC